MTPISATIKSSRRHMARVGLPKNRVNDGSLPAVCVICGQEADHWLFPGVTAPSLGWAFVSAWIGLLAFWGYVFSGRLSARDSRAGLPFCARHRNYWPRRARFIIGGFVFLVVTI